MPTPSPWPSTAGAQDRTESAFWYSGAKAAAQAYGLVGNTAKAAEMNAIAGKIKASILDLLWDDAPADGGSGGGGATWAGCPACSAARCASATAAQYVTLPAGIVGGLHDFTVSAWVNPSQVGAWSRVFDFGTGTTANMFLTVSAGAARRGSRSPPRAAARSSGSTLPRNCPRTAGRISR